MTQRPRVLRSETDDYIEFLDTGAAVRGEFQCSDCGYGVAVVRKLPLCPMCGGRSWEQSAASPSIRRRDSL